MTGDVERNARVYRIHHHRDPRPPVVGTAALNPRDDVDEPLPLVVDAAATTQAHTPPVGPGNGEPRRLETWRTVLRRVRTQRARGRTRRASPTNEELAARDRHRSKRARRYAVMRRTSWTVVRRCGRGVLVMAGGVARGVAHFAWQPELGTLYRAMDNSDLKARNMAELYRSRTIRIGLLLATGSGAWLAWPWVGPFLDDRFLGGDKGHPAWVWLLFAAAAAGGAWVWGWIDEAEHQAVGQDDGLPPGLVGGMGARSVEATFQRAFADLKIQGQVHAAHVGGQWGWRVTTDILSDFSRTELDRLARQLDTPRGGLLVSSPRDSSRARVFTVVLVDLLTVGQPAVQHPRLPLSVPRVLARRFDGGDLALALAGLHIAVFGRTGSGKSSVLSAFIDAFAAAGAVIGAIDMTDGYDLRGWAGVFDPRLCAFGDNVTHVATVLERVKGIALSRKGRTPAGQKWTSTDVEPPIRLVIDEYGIVAGNTALRDIVNWLILYGRNVDVFLLLASHRLVSDIMGDNTVASQVTCKVYLAIDANDIRTIPKATRDQGVAPERLVPANDDEVNDAGKGYVVGLQDPAPLVRFNSYAPGEAQRRALDYGRSGELSADDVEAMIELENVRQGVPPLLGKIEQAITHASADGRKPAKATSEEIVAYLHEHGFRDVTVQTLNKRVRAELGVAFPENRRQDTNLHGRNQKGWFLEDLQGAIALLTEMRQQ